MGFKVVFDSGLAGEYRVQVNDEIILTYHCEHFEPVNAPPYFLVHYHTQDAFDPSEGTVEFAGTNSRVDQHGHVFYLV